MSWTVEWARDDDMLHALVRDWTLTIRRDFGAQLTKPTFTGWASRLRDPSDPRISKFYFCAASEGEVCRKLEHAMLLPEAE